MIIKDIPQSGKRGLYVSQKGRFSLISRMLVTPRNPRSSFQSTVRSFLSSVTKNWKQLTEAQRQSWIITAKLIQAHPVLGQSNALTGNQLFTKVNCSLLSIGQAIVNDCPAVPAMEPLPISGLLITNTAGAIKLELLTTGTPPEGSTLRAAPPVSQGRYATPGMVQLGTLTSPVANKVNITTAYTTRFGVPLVASKVFVAVNQNINGFQDVPVLFSAIVPVAS